MLPSGSSGDAKLIFTSRAIRMFCYSYLSVMLGVYLKDVGLDSFFIGVIVTAIVGSGAAATLVGTIYADRIGRRRFLAICAALLALSGALFLVTTEPLLLLVAALTGSLSASGGEAGPFLSIEQAMLAQTGPDRSRNQLFGHYNTVGTTAAAAGALVSGLPDILLNTIGLDRLASYRPMYAFLMLAGLAVMFTSLRLSASIEVPRAGVIRHTMTPRTRGIITKLSLLFGLDSLAGGFVIGSLLSLWFNLKFGVPLGFLGPLFFMGNLLSALSFAAAVRLADRFGLINTMVFTHIPSNILLMCIPLAPNLWLGVALFMARQLLSQMDVPTRQSYTMAVVAPEERTAAAGITTMSRSIALIFSPALSGYALQYVSLALPFLIGGGLKIIYDISLFFVFRGIKPQDELDSIKERGRER
ncbi:MAG: MFS transporter [Dehalococcoidia bacterium]|nr:MFS transporter [Dehalococcoidia bacterium]